MSAELILAAVALVVSLVAVGLQLWHMKRDPNVPDL